MKKISSKVFRQLMGSFALKALSIIALIGLSVPEPGICSTISLTIEQQNSVITGRVTDNSGMPLPGVVVNVKSTNRSVPTNSDGRYTINVDKGSILVFSLIGMKKVEVTVRSQTVINVRLEEDNALLDEVIVVGYGTQKRASITGSVANITEKQIREAPVANISTIIGGRLPGLITKQASGQPGANDASLNIRGLSTTGNNAPVVIVDGVQRTFSNLDPNEIESITILKDASAAAVYGVQGANGVILVKTKRGGLKKPTITYSASLNMDKNTRFPKFLNGPDYAYWYSEAEKLDGVAEDKLRFTPEILNKIQNGDPDGVYGNTDWFDLLFKKQAYTQHHNVSVDGGSENIKYFVSLGYFNQNGIIKNVDFNRYNIRANIDANISRNLSVSLDIAGRNEKRENPAMSLAKGAFGNPITQAIAAHPVFLPNYEGIPSGNETGFNPIVARDMMGFSNSEYNIFLGNLNLNYKVPGIEGLKLSFLASYDKDYTYSKSLSTPAKLVRWNRALQHYNQPEYAFGTTLIEVTEGFGHYWRSTVQPSINYHSTFGKHDVAGLLVFEYSKTFYNGFGAGKRNFATADLPELSLAIEVTPNSVTGSSRETARAGYVGRFNYAYDNKYLFEFSGRYDGSTNFHKDHRWGFFPALSLGWRISNEPFFKERLSVVNDLKIRGSIGQLGNDRINPYQYLRLMEITTAPVAIIGGKPVQALYTGGIPREDITWEKSTNYNIGLEGQLWKGQLGIELDWFYKKTTDILQGISSTYPPSVGGYYPGTVNNGIVDNRGFELVLSHNNSLSRDFTYNVRGNVSWARNKIIKIDDSPNIPDYQKRIGRRIGEKLGFTALGLYQSQEEVDQWNQGPYKARPGDIRYADLNGDGTVTYEQDRSFVGKSNLPELMFGLNIGANYKRFDFSAFFQGAAIADLSLSGLYSQYGFDDNTQFTRAFYNNNNTPYYLIEDSWRPDNPGAKYPRLGVNVYSNVNAFASTWWNRDASYLRLKTIQVGYSLPKSLINRINADAIRFYIAGANLFTWSQFKYLDPEAPDVNNGYYPQQKTFTFGVRVGF